MDNKIKNNNYLMVLVDNLIVKFSIFIGYVTIHGRPYKADYGVAYYMSEHSWHSKSQHSFLLLPNINAFAHSTDSSDSTDQDLAQSF